MSLAPAPLPEPFASLSDDAKAVGAAFFGTWTAASGSSLRFGMVRSRPTDRARAALDEAEAAGIVSAERSRDGSVTYRPLIDCTPSSAGTSTGARTERSKTSGSRSRSRPARAHDHPPFLPALAGPLLQLVRESREAESPPARTSLGNLEFLLVRILEDETLPEDKANRWIGFVQGVLAARGLLDVDAERDATRPILHAYYRSIGMEPPGTIQSDGD